MSAPKRPQKAKGPGICSGPQLGVASRDPAILSSYSRAYPWQAMVDRQQRQAARPQRMRDIRPPLCRVAVRLSRNERQSGFRTSWPRSKLLRRANRLWFGVRRCEGAAVGTEVRGKVPRKVRRHEVRRRTAEPASAPPCRPANLRPNPRTSALPHHCEPSHDRFGATAVKRRIPFGASLTASSPRVTVAG